MMAIAGGIILAFVVITCWSLIWRLAAFLIFWGVIIAAGAAAYFQLIA